MTQVENEARKALQCLFIQVPAEVAADVKRKVLAWVDDLEQQIEDEIQRRDRYHDAVTQAHVALGGDGEWRAHVGGSPEPPHSGSLNLDVPVLAQNLRGWVADVEKTLGELRGLIAECLALNPVVSGDMEKVRVWADVVARMKEAASE